MKHFIQITSAQLPGQRTCDFPLAGQQLFVRVLIVLFRLFLTDKTTVKKSSWF